MSPAALVRRARVEDISDIMALQRATPEAPHWSEAEYREYLGAQSPGLLQKALWVAVVEGVVCGFAAASAVADQAELESIAVAAHIREKGLGGQLLGVADEWAFRCGARALLLEVRSANNRAQAFYRSRGFLQEGFRARYYRDPDDDAVVMSVDLTREPRLEKREDIGEL